MQTSLIDPPQEKSAGAGVHGRGKSTSANTASETPPTSTLIEFPGRSVPEWRRQLSQRVREVQEQRSREAAEADAATRAAESVSCALPSGQLELVPDREQTPMNPIVSKALQRVDRARRAEHPSSGFSAAATAPALLPPEDEVPEARPGDPVEDKPKLTIVASAAVAKEEPPRKSKPVRVISGQIEDSALSYLETCLSVPALACDTRHDVAGLGRRAVAGVLDLLLVGVMVAPAAVAIEFTSGDWLNPGVIGVMAGIIATTTFVYLTLTIALTGRTLSMRWLSLKTIDLSTGLIPTGGQAIKRSFAYVFSLALLGLGLAYAFIDPDHRTVHDRFSHTIVVRD